MTAEEAMDVVLDGLSSDDDIIAVADVPKEKGAKKAGVSFNYSADSVVRDRKELEDENARQAGGNAATIMKQNKMNKTAAKNEIMKAYRLNISHPDVVTVCDGISSRLIKQKATTKSLAALTSQIVHDLHVKDPTMDKINKRKCVAEANKEILQEMKLRKELGLPTAALAAEIRDNEEMTIDIWGSGKEKAKKAKVDHEGYYSC